MKLRSPLRIFCGKWALVPIAVLFCLPTAMAQGAAPETAPALFPGGELISYSSNFTTRALMHESATIPSTAQPTFSHDGTFNFTWGFYRDFDLTILVPMVTNYFDGASPNTAGTGLGDAMALLKYRFSTGFTTRHNTSVNQLWPQDSNRTYRPEGHKWHSASSHIAARFRFNGRVSRSELDIHRAF